MAYDGGKIPNVMGDFPPCPDPKDTPTGTRETVGMEGNSQGSEVHSPLSGGWPGASPGSHPSEIPVITMQNIPGHPATKPTDAIVTGQAITGKKGG